MREPYCECCDLPVSMCGRAVEKHQADERRALVQRALTEPGVKAAKYPGNCPTCGTRFPVGEPVKATGDHQQQTRWRPVLCCPALSD